MLVKVKFADAARSAVRLFCEFYAYFVTYFMLICCVMNIYVKRY